MPECEDGTVASDRMQVMCRELAKRADPIVFLFKRGRRERLADSPIGPTEFFYGYREMQAAGIQVAMLDEGELGVEGPVPLLWRIASRVSMWAFGVHIWAVARLAKQTGRLGHWPVIVTVTNSFGLSLAVLKALRRLSPRVIFVAMGLVANREPGWRLFVYRRLLRHVTLVAISRGEAAHLSAVLGGIDIRYLPFGVDAEFWTPEASQTRDKYVLSVGNDPQRDFATLIEAWRDEYPLLKIVTSQTLSADAPNIEIVRGDWRGQVIGDAELRDMVRGALFVVVPLRRTLQPSGQSACLQAMACGKAVILSDIAGLWDRDLMVSGKSCVLVLPESVSALQDAIDAALARPGELSPIGRRARQVIEEHLNTKIMAGALAEICAADGQS